MNALRFSYSNTALFWVFDADRSVSKYDTRLVRRWNLDTKPQISISDYAVLGNNPIKMIDWAGDSNVVNKYGDITYFDMMGMLKGSDLRVFQNDYKKTGKSKNIGSLGGGY